MAPVRDAYRRRRADDPNFLAGVGDGVISSPHDYAPIHLTGGMRKATRRLPRLQSLFQTDSRRVSSPNPPFMAIFLR